MRDVAIAAAFTFVIGVGLDAQQRPARDQPVAPLVGTAIISGVVATDDAGARPVARAQLLIVGTDTGYIRITESDDQGRFALAGLPAGRYLLGATKASYLNAAYGAKRAGLPGTAISLEDGQRMSNLALKLTPGGVITGVVTDERGRPAPGATVRLQKVETKRATASASSSLALAMMMDSNAATGRTDDRGAYRLFGVEPGQYTIVVSMANTAAADVRALSEADIQAGLQALRDPNRPDTSARTPAAPPASTVLPSATSPNGNAMFDFSPQPPQTGFAGNGPTVGYAPVYYPGTAELADATPITIKAGEERAGMDIRTMLVPTALIDCLVVTGDGQPTKNTQVTMRPAGLDATTSLFGLMAGQQYAGRPGPDGHYTFAGVAPGRYTITARTFVAAAERLGAGPADVPETPQWAMTDVTVTGQNLSGIVLTLQPGMTLSGRVVFNGEKTVEPSEKDLQIAVGVRPLRADALSATLAMNGNTVVKADRTFTVTGLVPSQYLVFGAVVPTGVNFSEALTWQVQSLTVGGKDVLDLPIDLKPNAPITDAVVTFTDRQQSVFGTLQDATGRPAPDYTVVLFATDPRYWVANSRRILTARPATDGRYEISGAGLGALGLGSGAVGLAPGEYYLAAVTDLGEGDQYDVTLLETLTKAAIKVTVAPGAKTRQDLRLAGGR